MAEDRPVEDEQLARVFKALADEHCAKRAILEKDATWKRITSRARERALRPSWLKRVLIPVAAAAGISAAVLLASYKRPLEYEVTGAASIADGEIRAGIAGASVVFSDGSTVVARPDSTLSLSIVGQQAALTRLLRGALSVSVHHDERADWRFLAGPYEIRVVGTRFDLTWEPEGSSLTIAMREGSVRVTGPGKFDQTLVAGETLRKSGIEPAPARVSARGHGLDTGADSPLQPSSPEVSTATTLKPLRALVPPKAGEPVPPKSAATMSLVPPEENWPELVSRGRFAEVVEAAEREGVDKALATHNLDELKALAQAARYTGKTNLALRSWRGVRERFAGHAEAPQAAFFLGRIYDELDQMAPAEAWLDTYLAEAPEGIYASEALGRRLGLAKRFGQLGDVERLATRYLATFPSGPYARSARALLKH